MRWLAFLFLLQTFEVASVKPSPPATGDTININLGTVRNNEVTLGNARLFDCIKFGWSLASDQQLEGPDWAKDKAIRFDVVAKGTPGATREQMLAMTRQLLTERFGLQMHAEQKKISHYVLSVGKGGSKLHEVDGNSTAPRQNFFGKIRNPAMTMQNLALILSRYTGDMVLDKTGLKGFYEVNLDWTPESAKPDTDTGPSLFTALPEQLGLRLERSKDAVEVWVIDSALKTPVAN